MSRPRGRAGAGPLPAGGAQGQGAGARAAPPPADPPARGAPRVTNEELRAELVTAHEAWRSLVRVRLGSAIAGAVRFKNGPLPIISNMSVLKRSHLFAGPNQSAILSDISMATALENGDGNWEAVIQSMGGPRLGASVSDLAAAFDRHVLPSRAKPGTRRGNWHYWSCVITWAIVRKATGELLPMRRDTLKALSMDLILFATSHSSIRAVWGAVNARHRLFGFTPPLNERLEFSAWVRSLGCIMGRPLSLKLPIHKSVVVWLLQWRPDHVAANRNRLMAALATLACLRVSELARLQVCDLWFDYLTDWGLPGYDGTCAVHVCNRKNDAERKGHHPVLGRSLDPRLDIVVQLRAWMRWMGLEVHPGCVKRQRPAARCLVCPPLFPTTQKGPGGATVVTNKACSPSRTSDCIKEAVAAAGCTSKRFSGVSARKGGISTAIDAGVPEPILFLQSGHGQAKAARNYMQLGDPRRLLETFEAFGL